MMSSSVSAGRVLKCAMTGPPVLRHISLVFEEKSIAIAGLSARMRATARTSACAGAGSLWIAAHAGSAPASFFGAPGEEDGDRMIKKAAAANRQEWNAGDRFSGRRMFFLLPSGPGDLDRYGDQRRIALDDLVDTVHGRVTEDLALVRRRPGHLDRVDRGRAAEPDLLLQAVASEAAAGPDRRVHPVTLVASVGFNERPPGRTGRPAAVSSHYKCEEALPQAHSRR